MEQTTLSYETINKEIEFCEDIIAQLDNELAELKIKEKNLTERLDVYRELKNRIPTGTAKEIVQHNMGILADQRLELIPKISNKITNIDSYQKVIESLQELRKEI